MLFWLDNLLATCFSIFPAPSELNLCILRPKGSGPCTSVNDYTSLVKTNKIPDLGPPSGFCIDRGLSRGGQKEKNIRIVFGPPIYKDNKTKATNSLSSFS